VRSVFFFFFFFSQRNFLFPFLETSSGGLSQKKTPFAGHFHPRLGVHLFTPSILPLQEVTEGFFLSSQPEKAFSGGAVAPIFNLGPSPPLSKLPGRLIPC